MGQLSGLGNLGQSSQNLNHMNQNANHSQTAQNLHVNSQMLFLQQQSLLGQMNNNNLDDQELISQQHQYSRMMNMQQQQHQNHQSNQLGAFGGLTNQTNGSGGIHQYTQNAATAQFGFSPSYQQLLEASQGASGNQFISQNSHPSSSPSMHVQSPQLMGNSGAPPPHGHLGNLMGNHVGHGLNQHQMQQMHQQQQQQKQHNQYFIPQSNQNY